MARDSDVWAFRSRADAPRQSATYPALGNGMAHWVPVTSEGDAPSPPGHDHLVRAVLRDCPSCAARRDSGMRAGCVAGT